MLPGSRRISIVLLLLGMTQIQSYSQQISPDTAFLAHSKKKIISLYSASIQHQSRLYNGSDYVIYISRDEEHPYFQIDDWTFGSVVYWGELYENVPLMYDLRADQIVAEHNRGNPIKLLPEKVQGFTILDHTFVRLNKDAQNKISEGFYDRLYDGASKVYAKHIKVYRENIIGREIIPEFEENTKYYVVKNGLFNTIKSKKSLLQVFEDHKQELRSFIRKNHIRFNENRKEAIVRITEFYDSLNE